MQFLVLFGLAAAMMLATNLLTVGQRQSAYVRLLEEDVRSRVLAETATEAVIAAITNPTDTLEADILKQGSIELQLVDDVVVLRLEDETGKLNPLTTASILLERYIDSLSGPFARLAQEELAAARVHDAVTAPLLSAMAAASSKELVAEDFTELSTSAGVDLRHASSRVLRSVPDLTPDEIARIEGTSLSDAELAAMSSYFEAGEPLFTVVAAPRPGGAAPTYRTTIRVTTTGKVQRLGPMR